jgi:hypothetical protein
MVALVGVSHHWKAQISTGIIRSGHLLASLFSFSPFGTAGCGKIIFLLQCNLLEQLCVVVAADVSSDLVQAANHVA